MNSAPNSEIKVIAPGRINLLGEHVDYNDGPVLPAAIDRYICLNAAPLKGNTVHLHALDFDERVSFRLDRLEKKETTEGHPLPGWALYPAGVAWALQRLGYPIQAVRADYRSSIPMGSGLSSSAAVESSFAVMWQTLGGWSADRMLLTKACQAAEVAYVGVQCGLMDQFICLHGLEDHALFLDTRTLEWEPLKLSKASLVIADSKIAHSLASSAYNERQDACLQAVALLQQRMPHIRALRDVSPEDLQRHGDILPAVILMRAQHVVDECLRVEQAAACLKAGDMTAFGCLMLAGHASLRDLFEVSIPELDLLVEIAAGIKGCWGARLTGAGFGGCTINLVEPGSVEDFMHVLAREYQHRTGRKADIFATHAVQGARFVGA